MQKHIAMLTPLIRCSSISSFEFASSAGSGQACIHDERMRWRTRSGNISKMAAANDEANHAWRVAA